MKKLKAVKKGAVLMMTSVILFVATSVVAVLSTVVLSARHQKMEYEYISRTQIILKNRSYELYYKVVLPTLTTRLNESNANKETNFYLEKTEIETTFFVSGYNNNLNLKWCKNPYEENKAYYEYSFKANDLGEYTTSSLKDVSIITTVHFSTNGDEDDYRNPDYYKLGEMRFY